MHFEHIVYVQRFMCKHILFSTFRTLRMDNVTKYNHEFFSLSHSPNIILTTAHCNDLYHISLLEGANYQDPVVSLLMKLLKR